MTSTVGSKDFVTVSICTEEKKKGRGCGCHQSREIVAALQKWSGEEDEVQDLIKIKEVSCLGFCPERGTAALVTPKDEEFKKLSDKNFYKLQKSILKRARKIRSAL